MIMFRYLVDPQFKTFLIAEFWKIFLLNNQISMAKKEYNILLNDKIKTSSEINLLRDNNLDSDIISEIAHKSLGLIGSDQIVIDITK